MEYRFSYLFGSLEEHVNHVLLQPYLVYPYTIHQQPNQLFKLIVQVFEGSSILTNDDLRIKSNGSPCQ